MHSDLNTKKNERKIIKMLYGNEQNVQITVTTALECIPFENTRLE